jgi:hypothetical protein
MKRIGILFAAVLAVALVWRLAFAAADYDTRSDKFASVVTVTTAGVKNVLIPDNIITIVHLNKQDDGTTASAATDYIVVMRNRDQAGAAVTMAANFNDGVKLPIYAGGSATFRGIDIPIGADGGREIQIQAVGNGAKVLILKGSIAR